MEAKDCYKALKTVVERYIGWAGCHACSSNKTGNNPDACKGCEIKEFEETIIACDKALDKP